MEFDAYTVVLLELRADAPDLDAVAAAELQDAHLNHLAVLHEAGSLLAAGPLTGGAEEPFVGLSVMRADRETAMRLAKSDPGVVAGRFSVRVLPWMVPAGAVSFSSTRFPHSIAEARGA